MNIVSSRSLFIRQTNEQTFAFLELLTEPIVIMIIIIEGQHTSCDPVTCHVTRSQPAYRVGRPGTAARPQRQGTIFFKKLYAIFLFWLYGDIELLISSC